MPNSSQTSQVRSLDYRQLLRESRIIDASALSRTLRLAILSDAASQHFAPLFHTLFHRAGIALELFEGGFAEFELQALNPASPLYGFRPDVILLAQCTQALRHAYYESAGSPGFPQSAADRIAAIWSAIQSHSTARVIQCNFALPYERVFGNYDVNVQATFYSSVLAVNARLTGASGVLLCDVESIASSVGRNSWFDERLWQIAKAFCHLGHLPLVCQAVVDIVRASLGQTVKCVAVDLDNTLWGGIVGDDGPLGLAVAAHGDGEPFYLFQHYLLSLKRRGILLAVCSKNEHDKAVEAFDTNPNMVLKRTDFSAFIANWENKAANIRTIQQTLNVGLDSIVFLDDNPFERNLVRELLPDVIVPELPEDPSEFVRALSSSGLFEVPSFSATDAERAALYAVENERREHSQSFTNVDDYLRSLGMTILVEPFTPPSLPRIAQLLQRSNQFNLTTHRHSEAECRRMMLDTAQYLPVSATLRDRFGDHGLIAIVIARRIENALEITDWLMSCRVMSRGVEQFLMNRLAGIALEKRIPEIYGDYIPTAKNGIVKEFYAQFGFVKIAEDNERSRWRLDVATYQPRPVFISEAS